MSASLVRKSLQIVDPSFNLNTGKKNKSKKGKEVFGLVPQNHKCVAKRPGRGGKAEKVNLLSSKHKLTVTEARKQFKTKEEILKENLKKLEIIKNASKVELDKDVVKQIIERAVTRRPIKKVNKQKKDQKTAFTEEDFKMFEREYFDE